MSKEINPEVAMNHYKTHLLAIKKYTDANRDKINENNRINYNKMKLDPEKHKLHKEKKRNAYKLKKEKLQENLEEKEI
jgi:hypothetical protein